MNSGPRAPLLQEQEDEEQFLQKLLEVELQYMPRVGLYTDHDKVQLRTLAVTLIFKLSKSEQFDAFVPYQAMTYFDQFLSRRDNLPELEGNENKNLKLLAIGCVSLSSKMRKKKFILPEFLRSFRIEISREHIMEMELAILDALEWRMISVTALSFFDYLFPFVRSRYPQHIQGFVRQMVLMTIVRAQGDVRFTHFKPSIIAATAFLKSAPACKDMILSLDYIDKGSVLMCLSAIDMGKAIRIRELMDVKYNNKGKGKEKVQGIRRPRGGIKIRETGTSLETISEDENEKDEEEITFASKEEKAEFVSKILRGTSRPRGGIKIHEAGTSSDTISKGGEEGEITVATDEEDIGFVDFELKWPSVELEEELEIPEPDLEPEPVLEPVVQNLYHRAVAVVAVQAENCNWCGIM